MQDIRRGAGRIWAVRLIPTRRRLLLSRNSMLRAITPRTLATSIMLATQVNFLSAALLHLHIQIKRDMHTVSG
jgi:hypothetical protein